MPRRSTLTLTVTAETYRGEDRALRVFVSHGLALRGGQMSEDGTTWTVTVPEKEPGDRDGYTLTASRPEGF